MDSYACTSRNKVSPAPQYSHISKLPQLSSYGSSSTPQRTIQGILQKNIDKTNERYANKHA